MEATTALLAFIDHANRQDVPIDRGRFQRLMYLLTADLGVPLPYPFGLRETGPFSPALARALDRLAAAFLVRQTPMPTGLRQLYVPPTVRATLTVPTPIARACATVLARYGRWPTPHLEVYAMAHLLAQREALRDRAPLTARLRAIRGHRDAALCAWAATAVLTRKAWS